jgi:hypothetical protein
MVCKAWRSAWGSLVPGLMLDQPMSVAAARSLGRKAATAFPGASKAIIKLYHSGKGHYVRLSCGSLIEHPVLDAERPTAAKSFCAPSSIPVQLTAGALLHIPVRIYSLHHPATCHPAATQPAAACAGPDRNAASYKRPSCHCSTPDAAAGTCAGHSTALG